MLDGLGHAWYNRGTSGKMVGEALSFMGRASATQPHISVRLRANGPALVKASHILPDGAGSLGLGRLPVFASRPCSKGWDIVAPTLEDHRRRIDSYLRVLRCEINDIRAINYSMSPETLALDFSRLRREYAWIMGDSHASLRQVWIYMRYIQELAELTGQTDPGPKERHLKKNLRREIIKRDGQTCYYCGRTGTKRKDADGKPWHIDHMLPRSRGGQDEYDNLVLSCAVCNMEKGTLTAQEYFDFIHKH